MFSKAFNRWLSQNQFDLFAFSSSILHGVVQPKTHTGPQLKVIVPPKYVHCTNILHNDDDFLDQFSTGWFFGLK